MLITRRNDIKHHSRKRTQFSTAKLGFLLSSLLICLSALRIIFVRSEAAKGCRTPGGNIGVQGLEMTAPSWLSFCGRTSPGTPAQYARIEHSRGRPVNTYIPYPYRFSPTKLKVVYGSIRLIVMCSLESSTSSRLSPQRMDSCHAHLSKSGYLVGNKHPQHKFLVLS